MNKARAKRAPTGGFFSSHIRPKVENFLPRINELDGGHGSRSGQDEKRSPKKVAARKRLEWFAEGLTRKTWRGRVVGMSQPPS